MAQAKERKATMFELDGVAYEFFYTSKRVEMIESAMDNKSILQVFGSTPTLREMRTLAGYGIREQGATAYVNPSKGFEIAQNYIEQNGLSKIMELASTAIMRDCGFLFQ